MSLLDIPLANAEELGIHDLPEGIHRVYAIAFDMDIECPPHALRRSLQQRLQRNKENPARPWFLWQQGSVYFGGDQINTVTCVLAAMDLAAKLPWFSASVRDIRMLRIEELNDLMPAVRNATRRQKK
jgi:virulence-associated protein VapD